VTLKSITGFRAYNETTFNDFDATGYVLYDNASRLKQEQISQELQLSGRVGSTIDFLLGAFYFGEEASNRVELCTGTDQHDWSIAACAAATTSG
jgi:iron complex outermembrane receptor protein